MGFRPVAVDLFAGAGGLALGFEQAGFDVVSAVEYDPVHAVIHELNCPRTKVICRNIREMTGADIRSESGLGDREIDVLIGGPPCQGFSLIGQRVLDDPRNNLVIHFVRLLRELKPRSFVMENVAGMAAGSHHQLLDELIEAMQAAGYSVRLPYKILQAADFGVPQDRRRLFLLGARSGLELADYPKETTTGRLKRRIQLDTEGQALGPSVMDAIGDLPDIDAYPELLESDVMHAQLGRGSRYAMALRGDVIDREDYSNPRAPRADGLTGCLRAVHTELSRSRFAATTPGQTELVSRFYRLPPNGVSNTLRAGTGSERGAFSAPRPIHPVYARCISVREAARLHSFPDWFRFHRTIWHGFRQIGNAVPPLLGRRVAESIMSALASKPAKASEKLVLGSEDLAQYNMRQAANHFGVSPKVIPGRLRTTAV